MASLSCSVIAQKILGEPARISAGEAYYTCPQHDDRHPSLKINLKKNVFLCGPCNASGGAWAFAAFLARVGPYEKKAVGAWLREHGFEREPSQPKAKEPEPEWREVAAFNYTPILRNVRFEGPSEEGRKPQKKYQWQHFEKGAWVPGAGGMDKPLYTNEPFRESDQIDYAVGLEGESKCDLAGTLGIPAFSFKYMTLAECAKLAGMEAILWPDADQPGIKQAKQAAELLHASGYPRLVRICSLPLEMPVAGDIVDAVKVLGWDRARIAQLLLGANKFPPDPNPIGIRLSTVGEKTADWLWQNRIPSGAITILDGDPGTGKSMLALEIAARVSRGQELPDNGLKHDPAGVIVLSAEDSLSHTVVPRLRMAGADMKRIIAIPYSVENPGDQCFTRLPRDLKMLRAAIEQENAKLVIFDVLASYIPQELSMHKDQDVRLALAPLSELADKTGVSFILLRHLNKNTGTAAIYRGGGSVAITGAARAALLLAKDQSNPDVRTLAVIKSNLGIIPQAVNLKIVTEDRIPKIEWQGMNNQTAEDLLSATANSSGQDSEDRSALSQAKEWLFELLAGGPMKADEVKNHARENCISVKTLYRAQTCLNVKPFRQGGFAGDGKWWWELKKSGSH